MGKFSWIEGASYTGEFLTNNIHGVGTYLWNDGRKYVGEWKDNKMSGNGVYSWPDGRRYEGEYVDDKKEGYGVYLWVDGKTLIEIKNQIMRSNCCCYTITFRQGICWIMESWKIAWNRNIY